jgi:hypothetical protein
MVALESRCFDQGSQPGIDVVVGLAEGDDMPGHPQRIAHQCLVVAIDECQVVGFGKPREPAAPATKTRRALADVADAAQEGQRSEHFDPVGMAQHVYGRLRPGAGDGAQGGRCQQSVADAGDIDDEDGLRRFDHAASRRNM